MANKYGGAFMRKKAQPLNINQRGGGAMATRQTQEPAPARGPAAGLIEAAAASRGAAPREGAPPIPVTEPRMRETAAPPAMMRQPPPAMMRQAAPPAPPVATLPPQAPPPVTTPPPGFASAPQAPPAGGMYAQAGDPDQPPPVPGMEPFGQALPPSEGFEQTNGLMGQVVDAGVISPTGQGAGAVAAPPEVPPVVPPEAEEDPFTSWLLGRGEGDVRLTTKEKVEAKASEILDSSPDDYPDPEGEAAYNENVDVWEAQAAAKMKAEMARMGMLDSGQALYGLGLISAQAQQMKNEYKTQASDKAFAKYIETMKTMLQSWGHVLSDETKKELNEAILAKGEKSEEEANKESIKNNILSNRDKTAYDAEALAWLDEALDNGKSQSYINKYLTDDDDDGILELAWDAPEFESGEPGTGPEEGSWKAMIAEMEASSESGEAMAGDLWAAKTEEEKAEFLALSAEKAETYFNQKYPTEADRAALEEQLSLVKLALAGGHFGNMPEEHKAAYYAEIKESLKGLFGADPEILFGPDWVQLGIDLVEGWLGG